MSAPDLPADVGEIMDYIGTCAKNYGYLKWNEQAKLKADMMNMRHRWHRDRVSADALRDKCLEVDLTAEETGEVIDRLLKTQGGRRLVPQRTYASLARSHRPASPSSLFMPNEPSPTQA